MRGARAGGNGQASGAGQAFWSGSGRLCTLHPCVLGVLGAREIDPKVADPWSSPAIGAPTLIPVLTPVQKWEGREACGLSLPPRCGPEDRGGVRVGVTGSVSPRDPGHPLPLLPKQLLLSAVAPFSPRLPSGRAGDPANSERSAGSASWPSSGMHLIWEISRIALPWRSTLQFPGWVLGCSFHSIVSTLPPQVFFPLLTNGMGGGLLDHCGAVLGWGEPGRVRRSPAARAG